MPDTLAGTDGADYLLGTAQAERFEGGLGNDTLVSSGGADTMIGGADDDTYIVIGQVAINEVRTNSVTTVQGGRLDTVLVQGDTFSLLAAQQSSEAAIEILSASDPARTRGITLIGNLFGQVITGGAGNDTMDDGSTPGVLDPRIYGSFDTLRGLGGDDIYFVNNGSTSVEEAVGAGRDTIFVNPGTGYSLAANAEVEALTLLPGTLAVALTGNAFDQTITGNHGDNLLNGLGGNDILVGLGGNDTFLVRGPGDVVTEANGGGSDLIYTTVSYNLGSNEVEALSTVTQSDTNRIDLVGNFVSQTIVGNFGDNLLNGGSGADTLIGLRGNDLYAVGDSRIVLREEAGEGSDTVVTRVNYALAAGVSVEVLSAQDRGSTVGLALTGNGFAQTIAGTAGADTLTGGGGNDILIGAAGADLFVFASALGSGNIDAIADFQPGLDRLGLASDIFAAIGAALDPGEFVNGAAAADGDDRSLYNSSTGQVLYDADGNGSGAALVFALVTPGLTLTAASFEIVPPVTTV